MTDQQPATTMPDANDPPVTAAEATPPPAASSETPAAIPALTPAVAETLLGGAVSPGDGETEPQQEPQPAALPNYAAFTLPEGFTPDDAGLAEAVALFKEARLPQDQAQKFIDLAVAREKALADSAQATAQQGLQAFTDLQERWTKEVRSDPEIGGRRLNASLAAAARAMDRIGGVELREALNLTGAGNHPAVVKAFVRLGQAISEDRFAPAIPLSPASAPPSRTPAQRIYGSAPQGGAEEAGS